MEKALAILKGLDSTVIINGNEFIVQKEVEIEIEVLRYKVKQLKKREFPSKSEDQSYMVVDDDYKEYLEKIHSMFSEACSDYAKKSQYR